MSQQLVKTAWGYEVILHDANNVRFMIVGVSPTKSTPEQCFTKSDNIYYVKFGYGTLLINGKEIAISADQSYSVTRGDWHSIQNGSHTSLVIYRMQCGIDDCVLT